MSLSPEHKSQIQETLLERSPLLKAFIAPYEEMSTWEENLIHQTSITENEITLLLGQELISDTITRYVERGKTEGVFMSGIDDTDYACAVTNLFYIGWSTNQADVYEYFRDEIRRTYEALGYVLPRQENKDEDMTDAFLYDVAMMGQKKYRDWRAKGTKLSRVGENYENVFKDHINGLPPELFEGI